MQLRAQKSWPSQQAFATPCGKVAPTLRVPAEGGVPGRLTVLCSQKHRVPKRHKREPHSVWFVTIHTSSRMEARHTGGQLV